MKKAIYFGIFTLLSCCYNFEQQYQTESPEIEYGKALLGYYTTFNFVGIKSIYSDTVKIYENSNTSYDLERLLATLKSGESKIEYQRLEDSLSIEMIINDKEEKWVYARYLWKVKYPNMPMEIKIPVQTSWQFVDDKIVLEYTYYDSKFFEERLDHE